MVKKVEGPSLTCFQAMALRVFSHDRGIFDAII